MSDLTGVLIDGRYEIHDLLARGGMATVYTALDTRLDRIVAVKVMHSHLAQDEEFVSRFIREAKAAASLTHPNVIAVVKEADETKRLNFGGNWHTDWSFLETPPSYTLLHARELPPFGGDTLFANQILAFESLSTGMQAMLKKMQAVHSARRPYGPSSHLANKSHLRSMKIKTGEEALAEMLHPVVRNISESGQGALYLNKGYTIRFADMTEAESAGLLAYLYEQSVRAEFIIRVTWRANMLTIWDNRMLQHFAVNDYDGYRREMRRTSVMGEKPVPA